MPPPIAILGAGPSGLVLARLLEINNIEYTIFEQNESCTSVGQGGSLDIHAETGQLALKEAGLFDEFKLRARYDDQRLKIVNQHNQLIVLHDAEGQGDRPEIDRKELRSLLLDSIPSTRIRWNSNVQNVSKDPGGRMAVHLKGGHVEEGFRLVVGADGAWSKARSLVTAAKPQYSGFCYVQTSVSPSNAIHPTVFAQAGKGTCIGLGLGRQLVAQRMGDGTYNIYAGIPLAEKWREAYTEPSSFDKHCGEFLAGELAGWSPEITNWITHSDGECRNWPLYTMALDSMSWKSVPGVTLIGDAAHLSVPNGEGVNCGMHDGLQLAHEVARYGTDRLDEAVASYEKLMFPRAVAHITSGNELQKMMYGENAAQAMCEAFASDTHE